MGIKHEGRALHRLSSNPLEKAYHDAWLEANTSYGPGLVGCTLEYLMGDDNQRGEISERDALVAATVIQWLGSPVGQRFVENVLAGKVEVGCE